MSNPLALFLRQASAQPHRPAITQGSDVVTYGDLAERAAAAAAAIAAEGATHSPPPGEDPVGIGLAPGIDRIVALLGALGAGFPYVALDPAEVSPERHDAIVEIARPWVVIADHPGGAGHADPWQPRAVQGGVSRMAASRGAVVEERTVSLAALADGHRVPGSRTLQGPPPEGLGYIVFTSGSTGAPKGIEMRWGALSNLIGWQVRDPRLGRPARTAILTPLSFDVSFQEIFGTLATGGTLVVLDPDLRRDPRSLLRALSRESVERLYLPYVGLQALAEAFRRRPEEDLPLRDVITAGEQLKVTPAIVELFSALDGAALHNHYGPAETHVVTAHTLEGDPSAWPELPPIGRPIDHVGVKVVDESLGEVPFGGEGEIVLHGACLARGYRGLAADEATGFVDRPEEGWPDRAYRTGDVGRWSPEGSLEWIGRNDDQVKVRGHRVELGGVESVLARVPGVRQVAVVTRRLAGTNELVAYVQFDGGSIQSGAGPQAAPAEALENWQQVWDRAYADADPGADPTFDLTGWVSTFSGEPIPADEMREWVRNTTDRIRALSARRVVEVGCGTGLLLFRLAPGCDRYVGIDFSSTVIDRLADVVAARPELVPVVDVRCGSADSVVRALPESFEVAVLNSVLQHFPSADYLVRVLEAAIARVEPGGHLFIGDVTPSAFRAAFHTLVEVSRPDVPLDRDAVVARVGQREARDHELTVDPEFFDEFAAAHPRVGWAEVQLKRGVHRNELNDFRYDVTLHLDRVSKPTPRPTHFGGPEVSGEDPVAAILEAVASGQAVTGVPNARTLGAWKEWDRVFLGRTDARPDGVDPSRVFAAADARGLDVEVRPEDAFRTFSVHLRTEGAHGGAGTEGELEDRAGLLSRVGPYTSSPTRPGAPDLSLDRLREHAAESLPDYMRPGTYVRVSSFPMTTSGKIDRRRLPSPDRERPELGVPFARPTTELQAKVAEAWCEVLELDRVGIDDAFFDLGGNSILAVRLSGRLSELLQREVPLVSVFQFPTVRSFTDACGVPAPRTRSSGRERADRMRAAYRRGRRGEGG